MPSNRLLLISSEFPPGPGGIGNHAYNLASRLQRMGWEVHVVTPQKNADEEEIKAYNSNLSFPISRINRSSNKIANYLTDIRCIDQIIRRFRPDILLTSGMRSVWMASLVARIHHLPWVIAAHGGVEFGTINMVKRLINRWAYSRSNAVICVSEYTKKQLTGAGIRVKRLEVITNGADELSIYPIKSDLVEAWKQQNGLSNTMLLLTVGSVTQRKGQEVVIRALPLIRNHVGNVHYLMAGIPVIQNQLEILAGELGVKEYIHFLGKVDANTLRDLYNACDLFLMTSQHSSDGDSEGYGIAVIEAALCGKTAVVSAESGLAETVIDRKTGLHVPESSPSDTSNASIRLLQDPEFRNRLGQDAQIIAIEHQTWTKKAIEYERLLLEVIKTCQV